MSITLIIIIITALISYQALGNRNMFNQLKHFPYSEARNKEYHRFLSSGFVHGSIMHLAINMYVLYIFGTYVENTFLALFGETMGRVNFVILYLLTIIFADIPTFIKHKNNPNFASVGASGAVSGILFIFILLNPWATLLLMLVIPCPAIIAGIGYLIYSSWASKNTNDMIDHDAHFFGAVFGLLFVLVLKPGLLALFMDRLVNGFPF
ncbi:MAG TPA: rhomboid family intramembrane serine protease [Saprospiraceae bacterium]|nr:rhomboid family intramembrane serine protease [Saprospiraceae bacterium]